MAFGAKSAQTFPKREVTMFVLLNSHDCIRRQKRKKTKVKVNLLYLLLGKQSDDGARMPLT